MSGTGSIFLDFRVPTATTWFYLSLVLVIALFFRFGRPFSLRNWDLLTLFLLVPPLLYLAESQQEKRASERAVRVEATGLVMEAAGRLAAAPGPQAGELAAMSGELSQAVRQETEAARSVWFAYLWLLLGSAYFFLRCLADLGIVRKPPFVPNLSVGGLVCLGVTILAILGLEAALRLPEETVAAHASNFRIERAIVVVAVRSLALACLLALGAGLFWIGARHFHSPGTGMAAAVLCLLLPYTAFQVTVPHHGDQLEHTVASTLLIGALAAYRQPVSAGVFLAAGACTALYPVLLFPLWLSFYWRRGAGRFSVAFLVVLALVGTYLWLTGDFLSRLGVVGRQMRVWEAPTPEGLWTGLQLHYAYCIPLIIAHLALVISTAFWPAPKNLAHLIALSAASILATQFWYADAGGTHVLWYLPLLVLLVLRPNLSERYASPIDPETDWLPRVLRWVRQRVARLIKTPEQPVRSAI